jgi:glycosyltransferase involved in cell wall biosynthesis
LLFAKVLAATIRKERHIQSSLTSIVIPVYNRADTVVESLRRIKSVLDSITASYEIIVVNDGSTDGTLEVLQREQQSDQRLKVISYLENMGKGYAVRKGVLETQGDIVIFTDGDLDIAPAIISEYIKQLQTCDLVIGSKKHPLSRVQMPGSRRFLSKAFNAIVRIATGIKAGDTQAGLKAGNGDALREIFGLMLVKRYAFDVEFLTIAALLRMNTREMPIEISLDRRFKLKDMIRMLVDVLAVAYRLRIRRWYQRQLEMEAGSVSR